mmetsp:Transcript_10472/g.18555  ORF Transcript_10472/g.18555 Transcript_10472/m.18555 type:complete len:119 (-) Transcript_10472:2-358(-)
MCSRSNVLTREYRRKDLAAGLGMTPSLSDEIRSACDAQPLSLFDCTASFGLVEATTSDVVSVGDCTPSGRSDLTDGSVDVGPTNADTKDDDSSRQLIERVESAGAEMVFIVFSFSRDK